MANIHTPPSSLRLSPDLSPDLSSAFNLPPTSNLWLAIRLPKLPLDSLPVDKNGDENNERKIIVSRNNKVWAVSDNLEHLNIELGSPTATAQLLESCAIKQVNISHLYEHLEQLKNTLYQFTPYIEEYEVTDKNHITHYGLFLEISQSLKLFKGAKTLLEKITHTLNKNKIRFVLAYGHTKHCAWLLSHHKDACFDSLQTQNAEPQSNQPSPQSKEVYIEKLQDLPLSLLTQFYRETDSLRKMGFLTFTDITKQLKETRLTGFRNRFSLDFCTYLEQLFEFEDQLGQQNLFSETKSIFSPNEYFSEAIQMESPIAIHTLLQPDLEILLNKLNQYLIDKQLQTQKIVWELTSIHKDKKEIEVSLDRLYTDWGLALNLTQIKLDNTPLDFEIDTLKLKCDNTSPLNLTGDDLIGSNLIEGGLNSNPYKKSNPHSKPNTQEIPCTVNNGLLNPYNTPKHHQQTRIAFAKITSRIGEDKAFKLRLKDSHIPEQSTDKINIETALNESNLYNSKLYKQELSPSHAPRPNWLFPEPYKINETNTNTKTRASTRTSGNPKFNNPKYNNSKYNSPNPQLRWQGNISLLQGPERIEGNWWEQAIARDYYIALRDDNLRLWIFHDIYTKEWFVHGVFS